MDAAFDELKSFVCDDITKALAVYAYIESLSDQRYSNVVNTLRALGLSSDEASKLYNDISKKIDGYLETSSYEEFEAKKRALEEAIRECLAKLNIVEEAKKRINSLSDEERKILQYAALGIVKIAEKFGYHDTKSFESDTLAEFVTAMISRNVSPEQLEKPFIKSLLAVRSHSSSRRNYYYTVKLIPNTIGLIKELAHVVEGEWPSYDYIYSKLRYSAEPYQIAALSEPDKDFYRAIYGYRDYDVLRSMAVSYTHLTLPTN